ncbi:MAG: copper resistance protein B [Chromatiales bacterium]|nr:copper resistance protein B [Chromatiales bacterium]
MADCRRLVLVAACSLLLANVGSALASGPGLPPVTPEMRAAAFPELSGDSKHMDDDAVYWKLLFDRFEWQDRAAGDTLAWKTRAWVGRDFNRLWLRSGGSRRGGSTGSGDVELLWGRAAAPWWDLVAGVRQDIGSGASRTYAALGVQGLAPYWFETEVTAYVGERGQLGLRLDLEYEVLLTNRLILVPETEIELWRRTDVDAGAGSGLSGVKAGLRLRYEVRREFAPYLGVEWSGRFGPTADIARASGKAIRDTRMVAGLRFWF